MTVAGGGGNDANVNVPARENDTGVAMGETASFVQLDADCPIELSLGQM